MNWSRKKTKTRECPFAPKTREAYEWFVNTVGDRPIRWARWHFLEECIFIKDYDVISGRIQDQSGYWWNICGGFTSYGILGSCWEFVDEI